MLLQLYYQRRFIGTCETNDQKFMPLQYIVVNMVMQLGQTFFGITSGTVHLRRRHFLGGRGQK